MRHSRSKTSRKILPPCVPNAVLTDGGIEWDDDPAVLDLERRWALVHRVQKEIDDEWHRSAVRQLNAVTGTVECDLLLKRLEEQENVKWQADRALEEKYLNELLVIVKRSAGKWRIKAQARLAAATREMNQETVARERRLFGIPRRAAK
jgi:hypothetical protein